VNGLHKKQYPTSVKNDIGWKAWPAGKFREHRIIMLFHKFIDMVITHRDASKFIEPADSSKKQRFVPDNVGKHDSG